MVEETRTDSLTRRTISNNACADWLAGSSSSILGPRGSTCRTPTGRASTPCGWPTRPIQWPISEERLVKMKITMNVAMDVDCTPDEARRFLGLPDMKPMEEVQQRLSRNLQLIMDPEAMLTAWLPATLKGFGQLQANCFRK
jgi:hypothetical protein